MVDLQEHQSRIGFVDALSVAVHQLRGKADAGYALSQLTAVSNLVSPLVLCGQQRIESPQLVHLFLILQCADAAGQRLNVLYIQRLRLAILLDNSDVLHSSVCFDGKVIKKACKIEAILED